MANRLTEQIALWADRLRHMPAMGLRFSRNSYDREHYQQMQEMALEMMGVATIAPTSIPEGKWAYGSMPMRNKNSPVIAANSLRYGG
jgi:hypothetical protein